MLMAWTKSISRLLLQLGVTILFIGAVEGLALSTSANQQAPTTSSLSRPSSANQKLHGEVTATITTSTSASTLLYLDVTTAAPDPLGMANVSGIYGPGAWAAWFITGFAAWWRTFARTEEKIDVNTWAFLFGINWGAVDILRTLHTLGSISPESDAEFGSHMGLFGAAFTVVFWGTCHAMLQAAITPGIFQYSGIRRQRILTHVVALILPLGALLASMYLFRSLQDGNLAFDMLPALYWRGMDRMHSFYLILASLTSVLFSVPAIMYFIARKSGSDEPEKAILVSWHVLLYLQPKSFFGVMIVYFASFISFIVSLVLGPAWFPLAMPFYVLLWLVFPIILPLAWVVLFSMGSAFYILYGYFRMNPDTRISESCFFMPCSPQSIKDEDQIYAALAGIFLFVGLEVLPPALKRLRQWYRDNWLFVQMVEAALNQFEIRRGTAATQGIDLENI